MAAKADGAIYINTAIETDGFKTGGKEVEAACRRMAKTVSGMGESAKLALQKQTDMFVKQNQQAARQEKKVEGLKRQYSELSRQKVETAEFKEIGKQIADDTAKLDRLQKTQDEFLAAGGKTNSTAYLKRENQMEELRNSIKYARMEQDHLLQSGGAYTAADTSGVEQKLAAEEQKLLQMSNSVNTAYETLKAKAAQCGVVMSQSAQGSFESIRDNAKVSRQDVVDLENELRQLTERQKELSNAGEVSPSDMFETVAIENSIKGIADKIRQLIQSEDWEGLGGYLAAGVNTALQKAYDAINWDNVGPLITYFINAFTSTFNSLVDNIDWELLGKTIGAGINTVVNTLILLIEGIDWKNLGAKLAEGLMGLIGEVDWGNLGRLIGNKFMIAWNMLYGFVTNLDFGEIGTAIGEALNGAVQAIDLETIGAALAGALTGIFEAAISFASTFDWKQLGTNIYQGINTFFTNTDWSALGEGASALVIGFLDTVVTAVEGTDWKQVGESVKTALANIDWAGIADKLCELIGAALGGLAAFLGGLLGDAAQGAKEYFEEKIEECGGDFILGILKGIVDALASIGIWIRDHVFTPIINGFKKAFGINSPSTVMAEQGGYIISGLLLGLKNNISSVLEWLKNIPGWFKEQFEKAYGYAKGAFSGAGEFFSGVWDGIKGAFGNITDWFEKKFSAAWQAVKDVFSAGGEVFAGITDGILDSLKSVINSLIDGINQVISIPFNGLNSALDTLRGIEIANFSPFSWMPSIAVPQIPYLATGAVIPPNAPFMAMLGDQKHGNNIETPEALLRKIVREESGQGNQGGGSYTFIGQVNRRVLFEEMIDEAKLRQTVSGRNPFELA